MQELNYRPKGVALLEFPLRAGSPAGGTITNVRWRDFSLPREGRSPPGCCFCRGMDEFCWKSLGIQLGEIFAENCHCA